MFLSLPASILLLIDDDVDVDDIVDVDVDFEVVLGGTRAKVFDFLDCARSKLDTDHSACSDIILDVHFMLK